MTPRRLLDLLLAAVMRGRPARYRGSRGAGQRWEELAARHLDATGYVIRERNFRGRTGEIDLIAMHGGVLCFVEVKGRRGTGFGPPAEAVTLEKQRRIARAAQEYLRRRRLPPSTRCRFDVVAIFDAGAGPKIEIFPDAFPVPEARGRRV